MAIWYRGEMEGGEVSSPGGHAHDFGDGAYFTDDLAVARRYASTRAYGRPDLQRVYSVSIEDGELGHILDLRTDDRWLQFVNTPLLPGITNMMFIRQANENYGRCFHNFIATFDIDMVEYNTVIGGEYVRGGNQLCILDNNGMGRQLQQMIRARFQPA